MIRTSTRKRRATDEEVFAASYVGMRCLSLLLIQRRARRFGQGAEGGEIGHGEVRQDLAIYVHLGEREAVDEVAVLDVVHARGGVDARDPEPAHVAFAVAAVTIGVAQRVHHGFARRLDQLMSRTPVAFGPFENLLVLFAGGDTPLDSWHCSPPPPASPSWPPGSPRPARCRRAAASSS